MIHLNYKSITLSYLIIFIIFDILHINFLLNLMILIQNSYFNHHLVKLFIFLHFKFIINANFI